MGEIRSAIDIALEKTANIQGDKSSAEARECKNAGKRAANDFISSGNGDSLAKLMEGKTPEQSKAVREGALAIFLAAIRLPSTDHDLGRIPTLGLGFDILVPNAGMKELFDQVAQIFSQYLAERSQLAKALEQQFLPRLKAKQQELSKRYGQTIPLDPMQDPEYMSALDKNHRAIDSKYEAVIGQVRDRVREAAGIEE
jgi:hypothetical protein